MGDELDFWRTIYMHDVYSIFPPSEVLENIIHFRFHLHQIWESGAGISHVYSTRTL